MTNVSKYLENDFKYELQLNSIYNIYFIVNIDNTQHITRLQYYIIGNFKTNTVCTYVHYTITFDKVVH